MFAPTQRSLDSQEVTVEARAPGEWIVGVQTGGPHVHVYRLAADDWLVSEVGRRNEGRGLNLAHALTALAAGTSSQLWWRLVPAALENTIER